MVPSAFRRSAVLSLTVLPSILIVAVPESFLTNIPSSRFVSGPAFIPEIVLLVMETLPVALSKPIPSPRAPEIVLFAIDIPLELVRLIARPDR